MAEKISNNKGNYSILQHLAGSKVAEQKSKKKAEATSKKEKDYEWLEKMQRQWLWDNSFLEI